MGGDHKCPVCQATFTRPQHVARHMRSHTGDRPYKCQYCGDQFARSDLLSRHVNKCHANEKPLPGATNGRRKGTTSLSRATTSKQACDQCVQSSLPCDGSNPCTKCVQRKYRCTYVKFHRQTAPVGPGHNPATVSAPPTRSAVDHPHHPSHGVLGMNNVPAVNISLGGSSLGHGGGAGSVGGMSDMGLGPVRFPTNNTYSSTSPVDDFYHLPPPNGYPSNAGASDAYGSAYTTSSRLVDDDLYGNRPGTGSSAGSSSTHGSSVGSVNGQWTRNVYNPAGAGAERLEPRALHGLTGPGAYGAAASQNAMQQQHAHHQQRQQQQQQWNQGVPSTHSGVGHVVGSGAGGPGGSYTQHSAAPPHDLEDLDLNAQAQNFRDLFSDEFGGSNPATSQQHDYAQASPLMRPGDGGMSDGGSDGGHSVSSQASRGSLSRRRGFDLSKAGEPYAFEYGQRRARAGSTASAASSRPSTRHGYDSISPSPLIPTQPLAPGQPPSATNATFSNAFGSLTLDDANALAALGGLGDGRSNLPQNDPDATPLGVPFQGRGSVLLGDDTGSVSSTSASIPSNASTAATSVSNSSGKDASNSLPGFSPIVRPLSSLAAYPPSTYLNQTWQQGAAQQAAMGGVADDNLFAWGAGGPVMYGSGTGWTPGVHSSGLGDYNFGAEAPGIGDGSGSDGSSGPGVGGLGVPAGFSMPTGLTPTPGKEDGGKDLKEFWKMYMRTPLTGPGFDPLGGTTPSGSSSSLANATGTPGANNSSAFRRPRVASMPSSNSTPRMYRDGAVAHLQHLQALSQQKGALGPMSSLRTTLHGPLGDGSSNVNAGAAGNQDVRSHHEDLSSYGAAVMARKTPVNLSLARALGRMKKQTVQEHSNQHQRTGSGTTTDGSISPSVSSRASSVGFGDDVAMGDRAAGAAGDHIVRPRPSVKRLASSVLESDVHKVGRFEDGDSDDTTPKGKLNSASSQSSSNISESSSTSTVVAAPKPSAPFSMPQVDNGGDGSKKSGMFPPPASLGGHGGAAPSSGGMMLPPSGLGMGAGSGSRPPSLLERRTRMAKAQQAVGGGSTASELQ